MKVGTIHRPGHKVTTVDRHLDPIEIAGVSGEQTLRGSEGRVWRPMADEEEVATFQHRMHRSRNLNEQLVEAEGPGDEHRDSSGSSATRTALTNRPTRTACCFRVGGMDCVAVVR
jgi:hypothetical protein